MEKKYLLMEWKVIQVYWCFATNLTSRLGTLNSWLRNNGGYVIDNDLNEDAVSKIDPTRIQYIGPFFGNSSIDPTTLKSMLDKEIIVIANVMDGAHFVLVVGYDEETLIGTNTISFRYCTDWSFRYVVNDPLIIIDHFRHTIKLMAGESMQWFNINIGCFTMKQKHPINFYIIYWPILFLISIYHWISSDLFLVLDRYVNDPGFNTALYTYDQIVGWRIFAML